MTSPDADRERDSGITFERESRTSHSECWTIERDGELAGRVDLHFTASSEVYATLCVTDDIDDDELQDIIAEVDERLVLPTDPYRQDFIVTVWRGEPAGVYSEDEEDEDEDEPDEIESASGNGRAPGA